MQYFKGDATELKYSAAAQEAFDVTGLQLDLLEAGCYSAVPLGEIIYDSQRSPLANAIDRDIFIHSFPEIFEAFIVAGTFESYITVFTKIFGEDVEITFTVPAPGKLNIDILAAGVEESPFVARYIEDNEYIFDNVTDGDADVDAETDNILFQTIKGFKTQYELEQMLHEMVPASIFTEITLSLL